MATARGHLMPPQQHLYNGLTRPACEYTLAQEWTRHRLRRLARLPMVIRVLAYGQP